MFTTHVRRPASLMLVALVVALLFSVVFVSAANAQSWIQVTVQRGDTLTKIANRFCTTWNEIYALNRAVIGANPSNVRVGTVLTVPNACGSPVEETGGIWDRGARRYATGAFSAPWYTVANGDTLSSIAQRFGTTVAILRSSNGVSGNNIWAGMVLVIGGGQNQPDPLPPPAYTERVSFARGAFSATRVGSVPAGDTMRYVLRAMAGQQMILASNSYGSALDLQIIGPSGNYIDVPGRNGQMWNSVSAYLATTGDYTVIVTQAPDGSPRYSFGFDITFTIQ